MVIYSTCFVNFNKKNTGIAALKVLKKNGVEVQEAYPGCCGMPFLEQADLPKVVEHAKKVSKDCILYLQPEWSVSKKITPFIVEYVMKHPKWKISLQTHKYLNIP